MDEIMFRCDICKKVSASGEKQTRVPSKLRDKVYKQIDRYGKEYVAGHGQEIVSEVAMCENCAKESK
jgi:hypothetical protein